MAWITVYTIGLAFIIAFMTAVWLLSLPLKNASIVDIFWGLGYVVAAGVYYALTPGGFMGRKLLILALVAVWGLRLTLHIFLRNRGAGEDYRYQAWRRQWGERYWWVSYFQVFLLQGGLLWIISAPLLAAQIAGQPDRLIWLDYAGAAVWGVGLFFEAVGDWQLARFKADPANKGQVMRAGLWRYTRHPNYFGDAAVWWGFYLIASATPGGFWTVFAPIVMTTLLMRVSGVALLEKSMKKRPGYAEYVASTSAFFPWFPRRPAKGNGA